ncbi:unnamed protein product [Urochloa humidicola]
MPVAAARSDAVCDCYTLASRAPPLAGSGSPSSSVAVSVAGGFPSWVLLEPFVFRRDDDEFFPDETKASIRAFGTVSWGARFRIAFSLAEPPRISCLYAHLPVPGFPSPNEADPLAILATHGPLALFCISTKTPTLNLFQDLFIYSAYENPCLLKLLPPCTEPAFGADGQFLCRPTTPRLFNTASIGLCYLGKEFVVAELSLYIPSNCFAVFADICLLRSCTSSSHNRGRWESMRVEILSTKNPDDNDLWHLRYWQTDTIIPFKQWLCWIDYNQGIFFCDMSKVPTPTVSFLRFPPDKFPLTNTDMATGKFWYRGVSVVNQDHELKFVNVTRQDGILFGALKPGTGFTITCHTLVLGCGTVFKEDCTVTSAELWDTNTSECLPRGILMFSQVDIDKPHVVHFLYIEFGHVKKNMWVVSIDMSTKTVESFSPYINNGEDGSIDMSIRSVESLSINRNGVLRTDDHDFIKEKSTSPMPFLPCEFPKFLHLSRKRTESYVSCFL